MPSAKMVLTLFDGFVLKCARINDKYQYFLLTSQQKIIDEN